MLGKELHWGIIGLGKIANKFASDLLLSDHSVLQNVASRDVAKAKAFSEKFKAVKYAQSYEELAHDPDVDIVYIATPHSFHFEQTMMCLENGKSVLCEKPMGMNSDQVNRMVEEARSRNLFLMEGIWTRFIPATEKLLELIHNNHIGDIISIRADFGFKADFEPEGRIFKKELGAGSLLDIGIYPIYLSLLLCGLPKEIKAMARFTETEVDSYCTALFNYENDAIATLESTIEADTPIEAHIYGTQGHLKLHSRFHHSEKISLYKNGDLQEVYDIKYQGEGYYHEIEEVYQCMLKGETESKKHTLRNTQDLMLIIDKVKRGINLTYN